YRWSSCTRTARSLPPATSGASACRGGGRSNRGSARKPKRTRPGRLPTRTWPRASSHPRRRLQPNGPLSRRTIADPTAAASNAAQHTAAIPVYGGKALLRGREYARRNPRRRGGTASWPRRTSATRRQAFAALAGSRGSLWPGEPRRAPRPHRRLARAARKGGAAPAAGCRRRLTCARPVRERAPKLNAGPLSVCDRVLGLFFCRFYLVFA